ncbi:hypothetical protein PAHAL_9G399100 [Panicum hallii]|uniref:Uncharacterized protein n=1 Tax=Panicum hallii TaxID=206008 RepID=A0A2T8I454_9POAL|nr:hypothetical protein PAHAL_9G399100 [Panicum hallii]
MAVLPATTVYGRGHSHHHSLSRRPRTTEGCQSVRSARCPTGRSHPDGRRERATGRDTRSHASSWPTGSANDHGSHCSQDCTTARLRDTERGRGGRERYPML